MVNSQIVAETVNALKIDLNTEQVPAAIPVVEVGLKCSKTAEIFSTVNVATGTSTLLASADNIRGDVYVTSIQFGVIKDATCDVATGSLPITVTIGGINKVIAYIPIITLTAQNIVISCSFPHPIKIDRKTAITSVGTFTAGVMIRTYVMTYYIDEVL
jgi:hypothetical protein